MNKTLLAHYAPSQIRKQRKARGMLTRFPHSTRKFPLKMPHFSQTQSNKSKSASTSLESVSSPEYFSYTHAQKKYLIFETRNSTKANKIPVFFSARDAIARNRIYNISSSLILMSSPPSNCLTAVALMAVPKHRSLKLIDSAASKGPKRLESGEKINEVQYSLGSKEKLVSSRVHQCNQYISVTQRFELTAMRLEDRLPLSLVELKCSMTCQLLFL